MAPWKIFLTWRAHAQKKAILKSRLGCGYWSILYFEYKSLHKTGKDKASEFFSFLTFLFALIYFLKHFTMDQANNFFNLKFKPVPLLKPPVDNQHIEKHSIFFLDTASHPNYQRVEKEDAKKKNGKYSLYEDDIEYLMFNSNCHHDFENRCFKKFTPEMIVEIRNEWCHDQGELISEQALYKRLSDYLALNETNSFDKKPPNSHFIINGYYTLILPQRPNVYLCVKAFCKIIGISIFKLENAARISKGEKILFDFVVSKTHSKDPSKALLVESFLSHIDEKWTVSKEIEIKNETYDYKLIFGFYSTANLYDWFCMNNTSIHVSYDWFMKVWEKKFPRLKCMRDRACPTCNFYLAQMKKYASSNMLLFNEAKLSYQDHNRDQKNIRDYVEKQIQEAKLQYIYPNALVIIMDHFGTHYIPVYKQSLSEFKSLDGHGVLGVSFSGVCNPVKDTNDYVIYNEPLNENSNVNCFHLDKYLSKWIKNHTTKKLVIASDTCAKIRYILFYTYFFPF